MNDIKRFLKSELTGWTALDIAWLAAATAVILGLSLYWGDTPASIITALTGVWCVILTGKGKRSSFLFGTVNVVCYALISLQARYYGEVMLNLLYYFPMNFVGWSAWKRHMNEETGEVVKRRLPRNRRVWVYGLTAAAILLYGLVLRALEAQPFQVEIHRGVVKHLGKQGEFLVKILSHAHMLAALSGVYKG